MAGSPKALDHGGDEHELFWTSRAGEPEAAPPGRSQSEPSAPKLGVPKLGGACRSWASEAGRAGVRARKGGSEPLVMVTAYDAPSARAAAAAGVDVILVGDSLGMVVLGYTDTLQVTMEDMVSHTAAVARAGPPQLVVADMPWTSYHLGRTKAVTNAARLVRAGAGAVKLEGGVKRLDVLNAILDTEIPVVGHLGLTPQSVHAMGGYRVQGRQPGTPSCWSRTPSPYPKRGVSRSFSKGCPMRWPPRSPGKSGCRPSG